MHANHKRELNMTLKMTVFWDTALHSLIDIDQVSEEVTASIISVMIEVGSSSEMSENIYEPTW
jgi:hypothetical protein